MEKFQYSGGFFTKIGNSKWEEWQQNQLAFHFAETKRDHDYITLFDSSRNIYVLLPENDGRSYYAYGGSSGWLDLYDVTRVTGLKRLRLSAWVSNPAAALGTINAGTGWKLVRDNRLKLQLGGNLDDLSPVATVMWANNGNVVWSVPGCLPGYQENQRISICREAVQKCHAAGVQILAGYEYVDHISAGSTGGSRFAAWLRSASDKTLNEHGKLIEKVLWHDIGADWDGIGFDIELAALKATDAIKFTRFYHLLAKRLADRGKILAIATGISGVVKNNEVVVSKPHTLGTNLAQPFETALNHPNIIIRSMAYDAGPVWHNYLRKWHTAVINYALNNLGLKCSQFQLGVKVINNDRYWDPQTKTIVYKTNSYCCLTNPNEVVVWCKEVLRPKDVGLITFAGIGHPKLWNAALNPGAASTGTVGEPLQVPLTKPLI